MVRHTDTEMIVTKEEVYTQRSRGMRGMAVLCGEALGQSGGSRDRERMRLRAFIEVFTGRN